MVNPSLPEPAPPGPWVDPIACDGCGNSYSDFRARVTYAELAAELRALWGDSWFKSGPGRGRRQILWAMRVRKLVYWYFIHQYCGLEMEMSP